MNKKVIVFDLDGTLVDSAFIIARIVNESFELYGIKQRFEAHHVGPPLEAMINAAADLNADQLALCVRYFRERYEAQAGETPLYSGALRAVEGLSSASELWVATYKRRSATEIILNATGLSDFFESRVLCADDQGGLSKTQMLAFIKRGHPAPAWMAMVGDTQSDHDAALEARYDAFCWARWGAALPISLSEGMAPIHSDSFDSLEAAISLASEEERVGRIE